MRKHLEQVGAVQKEDKLCYTPWSRIKDCRSAKITVYQAKNQRIKKSDEQV